ncbi:RNA polymerase II C-terminal domain kinase beta subunit [Microbotryomycetes sp. JL221]|nr:RNA polymerase II C-terminal domain kinase beta subunit [Microbotryomycetes sp. JL221]
MTIDWVQQQLQAGSPPLRCPSRSAVTDVDSGRKLLSEQRIDAQRQLACGFIERVGQRLGFPRRTIANAQSLYHRFHLHFQLKDFAYQDVSVAALLVAAKHQDTLKKLRDIQIAAWQVQNLLEGGNGIGEGDTVSQEARRPGLIGIERLILQTICFNFNPLRPLVANAFEGEQDAFDMNASTVDLPPTGRDTFTWLIKLAQSLNASKQFTFLAHLVAMDVFRTLIPLSYPPHTCATAAIFLATFLWKRHPNAKSWLKETTANGQPSTLDEDCGPQLDDGWMDEFESAEEDVHAIALALLDLFIQLCPPTAAVTASSYSGPSPGFAGPSPSSLLASPVDPLAHSSTRSNVAQSEKEKHLLATGVPHTLGLGWNGQLDKVGQGQQPTVLGSSPPDPSPSVNGSHPKSHASMSVFAPRSEGDFTRIKIRLREVAAEARDQRRNRIETLNDDERQQKRLRIGVDVDARDLARWRGGSRVVVEIEEARKELDEREREREQKRALRESTVTEDPQEQQNMQDKKPTSVRYMF